MPFDWFIDKQVCILLIEWLTNKFVFDELTSYHLIDWWKWWHLIGWYIVWVSKAITDLKGTGLHIEPAAESPQMSIFFEKIAIYLSGGHNYGRRAKQWVILTSPLINLCEWEEIGLSFTRLSRPLKSGLQTNISF